MQFINVSTPNSGAGDKLRDSFIKVNSNFQELLDLINSTSTGIGAIAGLEEALEELENDINTVGGTITNISNALSSVQSNITNLQTTQATQSSILSALQATVATHSTSVSTIQTNVSGITASIAQILATQSSLRTSVTTLQSTVATQSANITALQTGKLNKGANTEYELLADLSTIYSPMLFTRTGAAYRSSNLVWDENLKKLTIKGTQAIWQASSDVTDGNMGIMVLATASESFKIYDNGGNFFSTGYSTSGKKLSRVFTAFRLVNGVSYNETEYKTVECPASVTTPIKEILIPTDSIVTVDIFNINIMNTDKKSINGFAQFSFKNDGGTVSNISRDELRYGRQYSYIKTSPDYVTSSDTRIDASVTGLTASVNFVNTVAKLTNTHCEIKFSITQIPIEMT